MRRKITIYFAMLSCALLVVSCTEWGLFDPIAGNQVYPHLTKMIDIDFAEGEDLPSGVRLFSYDDEGAVPAIVNDQDHGSVLSLDGGYATIANTWSQDGLQEGISLTMWVKISPTTELGLSPDQDPFLSGSIFSFTNENSTQKLFFTANGWLYYEGLEGKYEQNNPEDDVTNLFTADEWHYLAVSITRDGYFVYINGESKFNNRGENNNFDFSSIVDFIQSASTMNLASGSSVQPNAMLVDDVILYRNVITQRQTDKPSVDPAGSEYYVVGEEDFSTPFFGAQSDLLSADGDCEFRYRFYNHHVSPGLNWNNWILVVNDGKPSGKEHFVMRSDAFGWGDCWNAANVSHNFIFDDKGTFVNDMQGALVNLHIKRVGARLDITAVVKSTSGATYNYTYFYDGIPEGAIGTALTVDASYIEIIKNETTQTELFDEGDYRVGETDFSSPWWSAFSKYYLVDSNDNILKLSFNNYSNMVNLWNNWIIVATNNKMRGEDGYKEYFVLRSDAFGWGSSYDATNLTHDYNFATFAQDMNGALVDMTVTLVDGRIDIVSKAESTNGKTLNISYFVENIPETEINIFFVIEGGYMDFVSESSFPFMDK